MTRHFFLPINPEIYPPIGQKIRPEAKKSLRFFRGNQHDGTKELMDIRF